MKNLLITVLIFAASAVSVAQGAELRLHKYYTDNMVLQRGKPLLIKGTAGAGAKVTVNFAGQRKATTADKAGRWRVTLDPMRANANGATLKVSARGARPAILSNVFVGDVLIFARQSIIDVSLGQKAQGRNAAKEYVWKRERRATPGPRLCTVRIVSIPTKDPQDDLSDNAVTGWTQVDGKSALLMSAAAFYLARDLAETLDVPLGVVDIHMGPHFGVAWLSDAALDESVARFPKHGDMPWYRKNFPKRLEKWESGETAKEANGRAMGLSPLQHPQYPGIAHNGTIHPLRGIAVKALVLQLGNDYPWVSYEALRRAGKSTDRRELDRAWTRGYFIYKHGFRMTPYTLPLVPGDWRKAFGDDALPVAMVLPPGSDYFEYAYHNIQVRELLRRTQEQIDGLDLVMAGTRNVPLSGQPADEALLAERCGKWLLSAVYKKGGAATGPVFERAAPGPGEVVISFKKGTAEGLAAKGDALEKFEVAGPDKEFVSCAARIDGNTIRLKSDKVHYIEFARYNWTNKPDQGLVNGAGLPAVPFTSLVDWTFAWWPRGPRSQPSAEYTTPANRWPKRDIAIVNGALNPSSGGDSERDPSMLGPTGIISDPFGPNLYVHYTMPGLPAHGKLLSGDIIYGANGEELGEDKYRKFANAISFSESNEGKGKLVLGVRRAGKLIDVEIQLEVLGSYSDTTPFFCPKSARLVRNAESWLARRARPQSGPAGEVSGVHGTDLWFLMASGKPEHQGLVRRAIYATMKQPPRKPDPMQRAIPWHIGYRAILLGEYYLSTGDPNVLPHLESLAGWAAVTQLKRKSEPGPQEPAHTEQQVGGYRSRYGPNRPMSTGGYGLMSAAGLPCVMGMVLAKEAGVKVNEVKLARGLKHFYHRRAEYGDVRYWYSNLWQDEPPTMRPEVEARGKLWSQNGKLGTAAALFKMADYPTAADVCSRICVYSFNNTRHGHGGMFYNNFWTPIGAHIAGESGYKHFMKGQTWWRELYRNYDGSFRQVGRGGIGVAYALHYVAQNKRLRFLGAPKSAFGANPPACLKAALEAHRKRDYPLAERLVRKALKEQVIPAEEMPIVQHMLTSVQTLNKSVEHDLAYVEDLITQEKHYYASPELPQLKGILAPNHPRLQAIVAALESPEGKERVATMAKALQAEAAAKRRESTERRAAAKTEKKEDWTCLMTEVATAHSPVKMSPLGKVPEDEATRWRIKVLETRDSEPKGWNQRVFDDASWPEATLPISWRVGHYALLRSTFTVEDKSAISALRIRGYFKYQSPIEVYLNDKLIAKCSSSSGHIEAPLTDYALQLTKEGENTIAIVTKHSDRWGNVRGEFSSAFGFGFRLDARMKDKLIEEY